MHAKMKIKGGLQFLKDKPLRRCLKASAIPSEFTSTPQPSAQDSTIKELCEN